MPVCRRPGQASEDPRKSSERLRPDEGQEPSSRRDDVDDNDDDEGRTDSATKRSDCDITILVDKRLHTRQNTATQSLISGDTNRPSI